MPSSSLLHALLGLALSAAAAAGPSGGTLPVGTSGGTGAPAASALSAHATRTDLSEFSQVTTSLGALRTTTAERYDGARAYEARYCGGPGNGFARGVMRVRWRPGETWSYGMALLLPTALDRHQQGEIDLLRWDNYPRFGPDGDFGGVVLYGSDHLARLERGRYSGAHDELGPAFALPRGRWFWLEVRQRLSAGDDARSTVAIDGRTVLTSDRPNAYGRAVQRIRYGIVAVNDRTQIDSLRLLFDRAAVQPTPIGALSAEGRRERAPSRPLARAPERVPHTCAP